MKKLLLIVVCLIAFLPKADWNELGAEGQQMFIQALSQIYFQKHPGCKKAKVLASETESGLIRIEIDEKEVQDEERDNHHL